MNCKENGFKRFINKMPWEWIGFAVALVMAFPYIILGEKCYIQIHDQLDGEVLNYIYSAKYLFSGLEYIPEFMNGMSASSMTPPAPIGILFYKILPPFAAFAVMHITAVLTGYIGMALLTKRITGYSLIAMIVAGIFVYLPFYPVYGLSILGQPFLLWALINIYETEGHKKSYYIIVLLYGLGSSFALVGFAWVILLAVMWIVIWIKKHKRNSGLGIALLTLLCTYIGCNFELIKKTLGIGNSYVTHREEMVAVAVSDWWSYFLEIFLQGGSYGKAYNKVIVIFAVFVLAGYPLVRRHTSKKCGQSYFLLAGLFSFALLISIAATFWRTEWVVALRMQIGGMLKYFQADRIYWLLPLCWYLVFALCMKLILDAGGKLCLVRYGATLAIAIMLAFGVYQNSTIYHNLRLMIFPETYHLMNWKDYYAEDVFTQIDEFIGKDKETYRTVSLGIVPAAALYNGFYCLDGYSNLYSLEYKHEFREIIEKELEKSEELRIYFDAWGNRCYLFNGETGNYMTIAGTNGGTFGHLELNTRKLYEMGARYIFAAMPIDNAADMNLVLARQTPFYTDESYYKIWLYEILY